MWQSLPEFGTGVLYAVLVCAAYTLAVSVIAGVSGRPRWLDAARKGAFGTVALVAVATLVLAYAFVTHDFRIRYVARYSDRSMPLPYLFAALWGGQDGSLLWWAFLLSGYTAACVAWMRGKYRELQPWVIATLMSILGFFGVVMLFAANPFWTTLAGAKPEGEGLNPLLQNFYMAIHPPSLYVGFVGCSVPFAFCVAALVSGRLDKEWILAARRWMLFAWLFLSIGNALGMLWAYEELGWGGYWAWDPVENAACLPWFTASAFLHSMVVQERRGMFKVWNVFLVMLTFWLTIFGTFLTRSGMIASVHSFAQSDIGKYFVAYMGILLGACLGLMVWRIPKLRAEGQIDSLASREAAFVGNNWALLAMPIFIGTATVFPKISELWSEPVTVGPTFYNRWMVPGGLAVFALMGVGTLFGWRKTSPEAMKRGFIAPVAVASIVGVLHVAFGAKLGFPALINDAPIYPGTLGVALALVGNFLPLLSVFLVAFNISVVIQEFARGVGARRSSNPEESVPTALVQLVAKAKRRYGGYIVHVGIAVMFFGFTGKAWGVDKETAMKPGESFVVSNYKLTYTGARMEVDPGKRMVFADIAVESASGAKLGTVSPAKFIYKRMPESPTTEVAMMHSLRDDLYVVVGTVNPQTKVATFQVHINALVSWVWGGVMILILGAFVCMWPDVALSEVGVWGFAKAGAGVTASIIIGLALALTPARAHAQSSSLHAGTVEMHTQVEHDLFPLLLCQCGACQRLPLSNCVCSEADAERARVRDMLAANKTKDDVLADYAARHGTGSLAVPPNQGKLKAIWMGPLLAIAVGGFFAVRVVRGWKKKGNAGADTQKPAPEGDDYDQKLDEELRKLDG